MRVVATVISLLRRTFLFLRAIPRRVRKIFRICRHEGPTELFYTFKDYLQRHDPDLYRVWLRRNRLTRSKIAAIRAQIDGFARHPLFSVIVPVYNTPEVWLRRCLESVLAQYYPHWELCLADDASTAPHVAPILREFMARDSRIKTIFRSDNGHIAAATNSALDLAIGEFVALLDHDDELAPEALYEMARCINAHPDADMIYSDEDKITETGERFSPFFKPDWSPDLFLSQMYTCHLGVYRTNLVRQVGGLREGFAGSQDYDLVLRLTEKTRAIYHIPKVLYHWRSQPQSTAADFQSKSYAHDSGLRALTEALARRGEAGTVETIAGLSGRYRVRYRLMGNPLVSIIIPTKDLAADLDVCLSSIFTKSDYSRFEIVIVDHASREEATQKLFMRWREREPERFRVVPFAGAFNFSALINRGAREARGELLLLLNNDMEVVTPEWLRDMAAQAMRPSVGAVGAKLLYPDDRIQHAGVVLGIGSIAGHSHKYFPDSNRGYYDRLRVTANYAAVTGACLMIRKNRFMEVGGFDETLSVAFNDVDFCIKLLKRGYYNLCLAHIVLYHHESRSRGEEDTLEKQDRFRGEIDEMKERWCAFLWNDPFYNPNLSKDREDFSIAIAPPRWLHGGFFR